MLNSKSDYRTVSVRNVPVAGRVVPVRERDYGKGASRVLLAEDFAFLMEGYNERTSSSYGGFGGGMWEGKWNGARKAVPWGGPSYGTDLSLRLEPERKKVFNDVAWLFNAWIPPSAFDGLGYATFLDTSSAESIPSEIEIPESEGLSVGSTGEQVEDAVVKACRLRSFSPLNRFDRDSAYVGRRDLDLANVRKAFRDLKELEYLLIPVKLDVSRSRTRVVSEKGHGWRKVYDGGGGFHWEDDQDMYGDEYSVDVKQAVNVRLAAPTVSFPDIGCYCLVTSFSSSDSTSTVYMSEKGNINSAQDDDGIVCCVSSVDVTAEDNLYLALPGDGAGAALQLDRMKRVIVVYRVWHRLSGEDGGGSEGYELHDTFVIRSYLPSGTKLKASWFSESKCREMLSDAGYPEQIDEHPDPRHTESCGVDLFAMYLVYDHRWRTSLKDVGWSY